MCIATTDLSDFEFESLLGQLHAYATYGDTVTCHAQTLVVSTLGHGCATGKSLQFSKPANADHCI